MLFETFAMTFDVNLFTCHTLFECSLSLYVCVIVSKIYTNIYIYVIFVRTNVNRPGNDRWSTCYQNLPYTNVNEALRSRGGATIRIMGVRHPHLFQILLHWHLPIH